MHFNTKKAALVAATGLIALLSAVGAGAVLEGPGISPNPTAITNITNAFALLKTGTNWLFAIVLVLAVIFLLVGAFQYMTAGGDAEKQGAARSRIVYALIGVAVAVLALTLVNIISVYFNTSTTSL